MSKSKDVLNQLAKLQEKPPRSARDLSVLEAAKIKASTVRQKVVTPVEKPSFFASLLSKPLWLGTGSLAAAALSVFVLFGHQVEPETKVASAPEAASPAPVAPAPPAPVVGVPAPQIAAKDESVARVEKASPTIKADRAIAKSEAKVVAPKVIASAEVAVIAPTLPPPVVLAETPKASPATAPVAAPAPASAPVALAAPMPPASEAARSQSTASGRVAIAAAPSVDSMARKRESVSSLNLSAVDPCVADIKAVPIEKQNLSIELTKQLLERCSRSVPKAQWPADIDWAKKLLDQQQEKLLLKSTEKPQ
jgi:hypothetical protein